MQQTESTNQIHELMVIVDLQIIILFIIYLFIYLLTAYLHTKFHKPGSNCSLVIAMRPSANKLFCMANVLFYSLQKYYLSKSCIFFLKKFKWY
jgi:hypothetical protein